MSANSGKELLEDFTNRAYKKKLWKIRDNIYHFVGYGHSNATIIEADNSLILIDTLDSDERAKKMITDFSKISKKPVKTIIFTHGHPDHRELSNFL
ncbi:MBL fold metallo-hydrolase [Alkalibacterium indicireducens]|uniref:Metallo-beta-lactamase domain-containing protein n=1 Tax=Alkalibacterium indicireducens TaxID=398758 RepID=A0ABN1B9W9_9LACT